MWRLRAVHTRSMTGLDGAWFIEAQTPAGHEVVIPVDRRQAEEIRAQLADRTDQTGAATLLVRVVISGDQLAADARRWLALIERPTTEGEA